MTGIPPDSLSDMKTPRSGQTLSWGSSPNSPNMTMAMKVYVSWWKRKSFWYLVALVLGLLVIQIDVDNEGVLWSIIKGVFNWVRPQPWLTAAMGGALGYFVRDRAIQLISKHDIPPEKGKK